eukprot:Cvel_33871.t1-p1 / transcript=Cvel_33871.t1 / gene=Cvel_33871 / organism=Chromera_velia_CCMP2878 / gene_product=hypothetical protein / transcript_product=hypothetical protein / location=Cvel_scaffold5640:49-4601(+) / protein_length=540 / sequence_SO=supercontig / SO=protein_coding / is_pseudo=false
MIPSRAYLPSTSPFLLPVGSVQIRRQDEEAELLVYPPELKAALAIFERGAETVPHAELVEVLKGQSEVLSEHVRTVYDVKKTHEKASQDAFQTETILRRTVAQLDRDLNVEKQKNATLSSSASHQGSPPQRSAEEDESNNQQLAALGEAAQARFADVREVEATVAECRAKGYFETAELLREEQESGMLVQAISQNIQSIPTDMPYEDFEALQRERLGLPTRRRDDQTAVPIEQRENEAVAVVEQQLRLEMEENKEALDRMKQSLEESEGRRERAQNELDQERRERKMELELLAQRDALKTEEMELEREEKRRLARQVAILELCAQTYDLFEQHYTTLFNHCRSVNTDRNMPSPTYLNNQLKEKKRALFSQRRDLTAPPAREARGQSAGIRRSPASRGEAHQAELREKREALTRAGRERANEDVRQFREEGGGDPQEAEENENEGAQIVSIQSFPLPLDHAEREELSFLRNSLPSLQGQVADQMAIHNDLQTQLLQEKKEKAELDKERTDALRKISSLEKVNEAESNKRNSLEAQLAAARK